MDITPEEIETARRYIVAAVEAYNLDMNEIYRQCKDGEDLAATPVRDAGEWLAWQRATPGLTVENWHSGDVTPIKVKIDEDEAVKALAEHFAKLYRVPAPHEVPAPGLYEPNWGGKGYRKLS